MQNLRDGFFIAASILILSSLSINNAFAEVIPPKNSGAGVIDRANLENFQNRQENKAKSKTKELDIDSSAVQDKDIPTVLHTLTFKLNNVRYSGNTIYNAADFEKFSTPLIGKQVSLDDIKVITKNITEFYRSNGYITSLAYIPPQTIKNGDVEIAIVEGKVGKLDIQGNKWARTTYIRNNLFKSNDIQNQKVFNVNNLKKSLSDMNSEEYLKGQVIIQKGVSPETSDIILKVDDKPPIGLSASWDNTGRELVGIQKGGITLTDYNLTGFGDSIYANTILASRTFGLSTGYSIPIGPYGTKLNFDYSQSNIKLGGMYKDFDIKGKSQGYAISLLQPIYKGDKLKINSNLIWDMRHSRTTILDYEYDKYELRVLRAGLSAILDDKRGEWISNLMVSTGIPIMGAKNNGGYGVGSGSFVKVNPSLARIQHLPKRILGIARVSAQFSPDAMKSEEQLQLGGAYSVRGFDEGVLLGDIGYNASLELRRTIPYLPNIKFPYLPKKINTLRLKDRIQFAAFYDQGYAKTIHSGRAGHFDNFIQSAGVGLRCHVTKFLMANLDLGIPLGRRRFDAQNSVMFHFSLSSDIF